MISRTRSLLNSLVALGALVLLLVGLPVVLYRFGGSPLPAAWPRIASVLSSKDDGTMLLGVIRACSWLAWLLFTACVLAEAQAAIRGRRAPHLRLGGLQGMAAHLIALSALAFATPSAVTLSASVTASSQPAVPGDQNALAPVSFAQQADATAASRLVIVRPGDCLWSLAQRYLGAGDRYPEIVGMNYGRAMGSGQVFRSPSFIEPGWQLRLPASATVGSAQRDTGSHHHLGHPTADHHYRRRHPAATKHPVQQPNPRHHHGNGVVAQAPARTIGAASAGPDSSVSGATPGSGMTDEGAHRTAVAQTGVKTSASADAADTALPEAAFFVTGALAGAVLTSMGRLRHKQRQERRRGRRIALPADPEVLATEQRLHAAAPVNQLETLRDALACLEASILSSGQELPDIVGLHVTPDALEVLLATPAADAPPAPFVISPGRQGMCWQLDLPAMVTVPARRGSARTDESDCHLLPGLITAGATDGGYLLLALETMQVVGCDGPNELVDQIITTVATELATGQWSGWYDLILVGCDELADLGRAEHCPTLNESLDLLAARTAAVARRIAERAPADVRELRLAEPDNEDWGLTILVSRAEPTAEQMTRLLQLVEDGPGGIAALVAGDPESDDGRMAPTVIQLAPDPERPDGIVANIVPLQIMVRPRGLSAAEYGAIGSLLATTADLDDVSQDEPPYVAYGAPPWIPQAAGLRPQAAAGSQFCVDDGCGLEQAREPEEVLRPEQAWESRLGWPTDGSLAPHRAGTPARGAQSPLEIRILGPFAIIGAAEQLQPKQAELVLALALAAPAGLSNSALCSMLGADPDHPKPADAVRQIITRTRRRLGLASDGQEYVIHAGNGQYVLHPDSTLDWSRFRELVASGRADDLRAAISLIHGQPFAGSYFWWIDIPLAETVRAEIVDAAETLAEFELAIGSPRAAAKAARAGLLAEASAEQLWRAVMRAEHAAGNLAGVAEAWRRCLDAIEDIAPDGEPHPDTAALYRQLTDSAHQHVEVH